MRQRGEGEGEGGRGRQRGGTYCGSPLNAPFMKISYPCTFRSTSNICIDISKDINEKKEGEKERRDTKKRGKEYLRNIDWKLSSYIRLWRSDPSAIQCVVEKPQRIRGYIPEFEKA